MKPVWLNLQRFDPLVCRFFNTMLKYEFENQIDILTGCLKCT